ncbi:MAG: Uma2 family endonuclease [Immundisolibacterales bacterium]|nr:Uma2 family endonuclease [Immundisolibacterales bacterium]
MAHSPSSATPSRRRSRSAGSSATSAPYGPADFPGCESFHLPESELDRYEGRLEFWDGRTGTAWKVCEPTTIHHERPVHVLAQVARELAALRGSPIECLGASDLVRVDVGGRKRWLMQADQVLYLHPGRSRPHGRAIVVGASPLPDVVLEVDHSTDVRRRKLSLYEEGGFPEVWVLVTPQSRAGWPRVTVHVLDGGAYRVSPESAALPGWRAEEIFGALTENPWTASTRRAVERVARAMGAREGTGPEDDPLSRSLIREGRAEGRQEGRTEGRREGCAAMVRAALGARGIDVSPTFEEALARAGAPPAEALMAAALACTGEADFLRRVRGSPG